MTVATGEVKATPASGDSSYPWNDPQLPAGSELLAEIVACSGDQIGSGGFGHGLTRAGGGLAGNPLDQGLTLATWQLA